jgi:type II secretory ATPase GspE/PulE/Tfp pilus assembly ATPase PilB-like protein
MGILPAPFCKSNLILAVKDKHVQRAFVLSNPFNLEIIDILEKFDAQNKSRKFIIAPPRAIEEILHDGSTLNRKQPDVKMMIDKEEEQLSENPVQDSITELSLSDIENQSALNIANKILYAAVSERASDVHVELKKNDCVIRFRIDGDMRTMFTMKKKIGSMLIGRFKAIGDMDIAERRKPQDGALEAVIDNKNFKLRLATTSTPEGENLVIRMLQPYARPKRLTDLGMIEEQAKTMMDVIDRTHGLILVVGPTGSGKTTTVYSLLSHVDCKVRNLVTIEDPVEYRMPFANQQQVNEKAGITFETLLKSVVRLDPDVIFLGEIRDQYSAKMAMDFASTGHLTLTTLHTTNTTTAVFRLERLGIDRGVMADAVLCVVAQKLVKKLCPHCKKIEKISTQEKSMLLGFSDEIPERVAHPIGCAKCYGTGYLGREGLYEILKFNPMVADMVRSGKPIAEIRNFFRDHGIYLISNHAIEKVKNLTSSPRDTYRNILAEEIEFFKVRR